jgi:Spy/CpxP family protein refolding chaperone
MMTLHHTIRFGGSDFTFLRRLIAAAAFVAATFAMQLLPAEAQGNRPQGQRPAQQQPAEPEEMAIDQIELTEKQIEAFIATEKEIAPITDKLKGNAQPSKQMMSQMELIAKKNGFKDFDEFGDVGANIGMVYGGIDPQSKKYDPGELIRREIAAVQGNNKIPAKQKQQILKDLQQASTSVPQLKYPTNAELVAKNYDRLKPVMGQ